MKFFAYFASVLTLVSYAAALKKFTYYTESYYIANGCKAGPGLTANFCGTPEAAGKFTCSCKNKYSLASFVYCVKEYFPNDNYERVAETFIGLCGPKYNLTTDYLDSNYESLKDKFVNLDEVTSFNKTSPKFPIYGSAVEKNARLDYISYRHRWRNVVVSNYIGIAFVAAVGVITVFAGIINWSARLSRSIALRNSKLENSVRKNFTLALVGRHLQATKFFGGVNPDRIETFFIVIMFLYSMLSNAILGFGYQHGDLIFANYQGGMSRYYGDRSCIVLSYQLPLLFIFPGRNNIFQYITRWKYSRFVAFHKWLARIIILEILIHSFAMASQTYGLHKDQRIHTPWYQYGIVAAVFSGAIYIMASAPFRRRFYEAFVAIHIIFVVTFLWTSWLHAESQDYEQFYYACIGVWVFDRFARIVRIFIFGGPRKIEVQYFPGEDILKLTVPESKILAARPGNHAFIHFLTPLRFLQSHPFTVFPAEKSGYVHFACRVKKGITRNLANKCQKNEKNTISMSVLIDGYYGEQSEYQHYDKTVFVTGGTGLSGPYFHAKKLSQNSTTQEVKLYWSVRSYATVKTYVDELYSLKDTKVKTIVYISQPEDSMNLGSNSNSSDDVENKDDKSDSTDSLLNDDDLSRLQYIVEFRHGRLPVAEIVDSEIADSTGSIAFGACAHPEVVDQVRTRVSRSLNASAGKMEYFEEMQQW